MAVGPSIFHFKVDAVDIVVRAHPLEKADGVSAGRYVRATCEETDPLRPLIQCLAERRNWRRARCRGSGANKRNELASSDHSITSSASASSLSGIWRPRALAVLRLIISSIFVSCWTGRSGGLSPLRMRPV